jgi:pimeloyl-ACP methyl ester carboxylesterase
MVMGCTNSGVSLKEPAPTGYKMVHVSDIDIAYNEYGNGDRLIMVMGYSGTMDMWDPTVIQALAKQYRVITFDNRGMGHSTSSDREYTIPLFASDIAGLMDALGIKKAHVLGFSMGTIIAQELMLDYPEKVDKLILYAADPGGKEMLPPAPKDIEALQNTTGTAKERGERLFFEMFPEAWLKQNPDPSEYFPKVTSMSQAENIKRQWKAMEMWNGSYSRLSTLTQPVLLITGDRDILTPPGNSLVIAEKVPASWVVRIRGGGHGVMYQYPAEFSDIVLTFLKDAW